MLSGQRTLRKEIHLFHYVAGPSHFIQHQQITKNHHGFKAPCPLLTSSLLHTFLPTMFVTDRSVLHVQKAQHAYSMFCETRKNYVSRRVSFYQEADSSTSSMQQLVLVLDVFMSDYFQMGLSCTNVYELYVSVFTILLLTVLFKRDTLCNTGV